MDAAIKDVGAIISFVEDLQPITASRRIGVPASVIFPILADAGPHREFDGTGMLRAWCPAPTIAGVVDVFVRQLHGRAPATGLEERDDGQ